MSHLCLFLLFFQLNPLMKLILCLFLLLHKYQLLLFYLLHQKHLQTHQKGCMFLCMCEVGIYTKVYYVLHFLQRRELLLFMLDDERSHLLLKLPYMFLFSEIFCLFHHNLKALRLFFQKVYQDSMQQHKQQERYLYCVLPEY